MSNTHKKLQKRSVLQALQRYFAQRRSTLGHFAMPRGKTLTEFERKEIVRFDAEGD